MILILGSSGMVGYAIKSICEKNKYLCFCPTHKELDITNKKKLEQYILKHKPSVVINCAAVVGRVPCNKDKKYAYLVNVESVYHLSKICAMYDILLVHISSSSVFDEKTGWYKETDNPNPISYYGRTKRLSELNVLNNCCKYYIIRLPLLFGPRDNNRSGLTDLFINKMNKKEDVNVSTDKIESFGYTFDIAEEIIEIVNNEYPYGIYHIRNDGESSLYNYVKFIKKFIDTPSIIYKCKCKDFGCNKSNLILDSTKIKFMRHWKKAMEEYLS